MATESVLQSLADDHEVRQVLYRYCRGIDRRDFDLVHHRQTVGHDACVRLGPADYLGAVALDDDEDPHSMPAR